MSTETPSGSSSSASTAFSFTVTVMFAKRKTFSNSMVLEEERRAMRKSAVAPPSAVTVMFVSVYMRLNEASSNASPKTPAA